MSYAEVEIRGSEDALFAALVDVTQSFKNGERVWAIKVPVNPSRFGTDEAFSVRLRSALGEGEIAKIVVRPLQGVSSLVTVPDNRTGGASPSELDPDGAHFADLWRLLLARLTRLGLYTPAGISKEKGPIGFRPPGEGHAS